MTNEILLSDMLNHYSLKLTEITDLLTEVMQDLKTTGLLVEDSWRGFSANAFAEKMVEIQRGFTRSADEFSKLTVLFNAAKNAALDAEAEQAQAVLESNWMTAAED